MKKIYKSMKESIGGLLFLIAGVAGTILISTPNIQEKDFDAASAYLMVPGLSLPVAGSSLYTGW